MKNSRAILGATTATDGMRKKVARLERSRLADWFDAQGRRRALVGAWAALLFALPVSAFVGFHFAAAMTGLSAFLGAGLLRHVVRMAADLPDAYLDERQVATRDRAYLYAYRTVASTGPIALFAIYLSMDLLDYVPSSTHLWAVGWSTLIMSVGAPSAALAWIEPDGRSGSEPDRVGHRS